MGAGNYNKILVYQLIKMQIFEVGYIIAKFSLNVIFMLTPFSSKHPDSAWKRSSKTCMKLTSADVQ